VRLQKAGGPQEHHQSGQAHHPHPGCRALHLFLQPPDPGPQKDRPAGQGHADQHPVRHPVLQPLRQVQTGLPHVRPGIRNALPSAQQEHQPGRAHRSHLLFPDRPGRARSGAPGKAARDRGPLHGLRQMRRGLLGQDRIRQGGPGTAQLPGSAGLRRPPHQVEDPQLSGGGPGQARAAGR